MLDLAWRVRTGRAGAPPPKAAHVDRARRLLGEGRGFEAFLALLELSYAVEDAPSDLLRSSGDRARSDPRMKAFVRAQESRDPRKALAQLEPLDPRSLEGGHVIHVLRASQRLRLQQGEEALQEFGLALEANPFLVGPWVDAGLYYYYYYGYRTTLAWTCWDAARAIAPGSAMLKQVNELEASLRKEHPEFFQAGRGRAPDQATPAGRPPRRRSASRRARGSVAPGDARLPRRRARLGGLRHSVRRTAARTRKRPRVTAIPPANGLPPRYVPFFALQRLPPGSAHWWRVLPAHASRPP